MAAGKLLFRTIVSRYVEIRFVVSSGLFPRCGFSLPRFSRAGTVLGVKLWGDATEEFGAE